MRTLLYFRIKDIAMARSVQTTLGDLRDPSNPIDGPWFSQNHDQPVDGLPGVDRGYTTYREEFALSGIPIGALLGGLAVYWYGTSTDDFANDFMAYVGAIAFGAMISWWLGGLVGGRIARLSLSRKQAHVAAGEILTIVSCASPSKEVTKRIIRDLGGVSIDEHKDYMPNFRWV